MQALVLYDSVFGNTEKIAQAIGRALARVAGSESEVATLPVSQVTPDMLAKLNLLVVGSPTRGFRPTEGLTAFLTGLPAGSLGGVRVAAFDTRFCEADVKWALRLLIRVGGYAAKPIAARLQKAGGTLIAPPEGFFVRDTEGPLKEGELERAGSWARSLFAAG